MAKNGDLKTLARIVAAAASFAVAATPAFAQSASTAAFGSLGWSKSEALLGAPSAFQAIMAQQNGIAPAHSSFQPVKATFQPASYSTPNFAPRTIPAIVPD